MAAVVSNSLPLLRRSVPFGPRTGEMKGLRGHVGEEVGKSACWIDAESGYNSPKCLL